MEETILLCNSDPHHPFTSFVGAVKIIVIQSEAVMKNLFFDINTTIKNKLGSNSEKLTERHNRREQADLDEGNNETCTSTF